jgi:hypothetical protein
VIFIFLAFVPALPLSRENAAQRPKALNSRAPLTGNEPTHTVKVYYLKANKQYFRVRAFDSEVVRHEKAKALAGS